MRGIEAGCRCEGLPRRGSEPKDRPSLRESAPGEGENGIESGELDGRGEAVGGGKRGDGWKGVDVGFEIAGGAVVWSV